MGKNTVIGRLVVLDWCVDQRIPSTLAPFLGEIDWPDASSAEVAQRSPTALGVGGSGGAVAAVDGGLLDCWDIWVSWVV